MEENQRGRGASDRVIISGTFWKDKVGKRRWEGFNWYHKEFAKCKVGKRGRQSIYWVVELRYNRKGKVGERTGEDGENIIKGGGEGKVGKRKKDFSELIRL